MGRPWMNDKSEEDDDPFHIEPVYASSTGTKKTITVSQETEVITENLDQNYEFPNVDRVHYAIHPGVLETMDEPYERVYEIEEFGLTPAKYSKFQSEIVTNLSEVDEMAYILAPHDQKQEVQEFLEGYEPDGWLKTWSEGAQLKDRQTRKNLTQQLANTYDNSEIIVHGELRGRCIDRFQNLLESVRENSDLSYEIREGVIFPEEPLPKFL
jgi:hypothetical protein